MVLEVAVPNADPDPSRHGECAGGFDQLYPVYLHRGLAGKHDCSICIFVSAGVKSDHGTPVCPTRQCDILRPAARAGGYHCPGLLSAGYCGTHHQRISIRFVYGQS